MILKPSQKAPLSPPIIPSSSEPVNISKGITLSQEQQWWRETLKASRISRGKFCPPTPALPSMPVVGGWVCYVPSFRDGVWLHVWLQPTLLLQWRVWCPPTQEQAGPLIHHSAVSLRHDKGQTETWPDRAVLCQGEPGKCAGFTPFCHFQKKAAHVRLDTDCGFYVGCACAWTFEKYKLIQKWMKEPW